MIRFWPFALRPVEASEIQSEVLTLQVVSTELLRATQALENRCYDVSRRINYLA